MNLRLRSVESRREAEDVLPSLVRAVYETIRALREEAGEEEAERHARGWIARAEGEPSALLLVGEDAQRPLAVAATAPFVDPLDGGVRPMLVVLWVDPSIRHRGVARALVAELRRILAARGFRVLTARAGTGDDALLSMGERWGLVRSWEFLSSE